MIEYRRKVLSNGLVVLAHRDRSTSMAATNIIYKVGARDEDPDHTGFAHLFEHLMFSGSRNAPSFDMPVQMASGENNAFTNNDYTDFYITLPKDNIDTALWLESDRMTDLDINASSLDIQKKVVVEEFNERYLNKPYGDLWLKLRPLLYSVHPYGWPTIGKSPDHIRNATLDMVRDFYDRYYHPSNAIMAIAGDYDYDRMFDMAEARFGHITKRGSRKRPLPAEPQQTAPRELTIEGDVPASLVYAVFHMCPRADERFVVCDTLSDLLSGGTSSRLYRSLVKGEALFASVNAYVTGDIDPGLFIAGGQVSEGVDPQKAREALMEQLKAMCCEKVGEYELDKVQNKFEANTLFGEVNVMDKAMNLCFYEMLGDISLVNEEVSRYRSVTPEAIVETARELFAENNTTTLYYLKK
ncbi:MAG: insulinase family protein [Rikenellaceae bacterium]|nr:insulinase family protein [Rikenellaceae bacterium]